MTKRPSHGTREHFIYVELAVRKKLGIGRRHIIDGLPEKFNTTRGHIWDVYRRYILGRDVKELS